MPKPHTLTLRAYGVGFGDCFLLTFFYDSEPTHDVLIEFFLQSPSVWVAAAKYVSTRSDW